MPCKSKRGTGTATGARPAGGIFKAAMFSCARNKLSFTLRRFQKPQSQSHYLELRGFSQPFPMAARSAGVFFGSSTQESVPAMRKGDIDLDEGGRRSRQLVSRFFSARFGLATRSTNFVGSFSGALWRG